MNVFEKLRLRLGWYPKKKRAYSAENEFISDYANCNTAGANDKPVETMDVPIQIWFLSHPSINKVKIYTTAAGQIADLIEKVLHTGRYNDNKHL